MKCENCKKLRKKIRSLKYEILMLEQLETLAQVGDWDLEEIHREILEGSNYGVEVKPDPEFAEWFAKKYGVKNENM